MCLFAILTIRETFFKKIQLLCARARDIPRSGECHVDAHEVTPAQANADYISS